GLLVAVVGDDGHLRTLRAEADLAGVRLARQVVVLVGGDVDAAVDIDNGVVLDVGLGVALDREDSHGETARVESAACDAADLDRRPARLLRPDAQVAGRDVGTCADEGQGAHVRGRGAVQGFGGAQRLDAVRVAGTLRGQVDGHAGLGVVAAGGQLQLLAVRRIDDDEVGLAALQPAHRGPAGAGVVDDLLAGVETLRVLHRHGVAAEIDVRVRVDGRVAVDDGADQRTVVADVRPDQAGVARGLRVAAGGNMVAGVAVALVSSHVVGDTC